MSAWEKSNVGTIGWTGRLARASSRAAHNATYAPVGDYATNDAVQAALATVGGGTPATPGFEALAAKIAFGGLGQLSIATAADSTANDLYDWMRLWYLSLLGLMPSTTRGQYHGWNNSTSAWSNLVDREGEWSPGSDGVRLLDDFETNPGPVAGRVPARGSAWANPYGAWSVSGGKLVKSGAAVGAAVTNVGQGAAVTFTVRVDLSAGGVAESFRAYLGSTSAGTDGVWVGLTVGTGGYPAFAIYKTIGGTSTSIGTVNTSGLAITPTGGWHTLTITLERQIQNVTLTIEDGASGSAETTGTITEADATALAANDHFTLWSNTSEAKFEFETITATAAPQSAEGDLIEVWNGAIAGSKTATFNSGKRSQMWGGKHIDMLVVAFGHNNGTQSPEAFTDELETWVDAWLADHPETKYVILSSQNPQHPPATNRAAHAARQYAVRMLARRRGWDYIPAFEAFAAEPDGGLSRMWPDGIHPSADEVAPHTRPTYGQPFWADVALKCVTDRI